MTSRWLVSSTEAGASTRPFSSYSASLHRCATLPPVRMDQSCESKKLLSFHMCSQYCCEQFMFSQFHSFTVSHQFCHLLLLFSCCLRRNTEYFRMVELLFCHAPSIGPRGKRLERYVPCMSLRENMRKLKYDKGIQRQVCVSKRNQAIFKFLSKRETNQYHSCFKSSKVRV